jgi:hypothetical protein
MKEFTKQDYDKLQAALEMVEKKFNLPRWSLGDELVDRQNVLIDGMTEDHPDFWVNMYAAAISAANERLEVAGVVVSVEEQV